MEQYSNFLSVVFRDENKISVYNSITLQDRYENEVKNFSNETRYLYMLYISPARQLLIRRRYLKNDKIRVETWKRIDGYLIERA